MKLLASVLGLWFVSSTSGIWNKNNNKNACEITCHRTKTKHNTQAYEQRACQWMNRNVPRVVNSRVENPLTRWLCDVDEGTIRICWARMSRICWCIDTTSFIIYWHSSETRQDKYHNDDTDERLLLVQVISHSDLGPDLTVTCNTKTRSFFLFFLSGSCKRLSMNHQV